MGIISHCTKPKKESSLTRLFFRFLNAKISLNQKEESYDLQKEECLEKKKKGSYHFIFDTTPFLISLSSLEIWAYYVSMV